MRIGVLKKEQFPTERATFFLKTTEAKDLVKSGCAVWVEAGRTIQRIVPLRLPRQLGFASIKWGPR
jgi:hypothetical protein